MQATRRSLFVYVQSVIPAILLGRIVYRISRSRRPWLKNLLIRGFAWAYDVDFAEASAPTPGDYESFNAFFTRSLRPGARTFTKDADHIASPADGTVQQCGDLDGESLLQVKGVSYSLSALLGESRAWTEFNDGAFITVYLAPHNYHRIHMPCAGGLRRMVYLPGARWSVNARTVAVIPGLFALNERLVFHFDAPFGPFAIVMVGALNVGSMSTAWNGEVLPTANRVRREWEFTNQNNQVSLGSGEYLAHFNLGSTVVMVFPRGVTRWRDDLAAGVSLKVGEPIGDAQIQRGNFG
jgi:phosphatidylserine decarboxylase